MAYSEALWQDAKKKCRLNNEDTKIAKELGLNPKSLIKNVPNRISSDEYEIINMTTFELSFFYSLKGTSHRYR